jgi:hypothetical protein
MIESGNGGRESDASKKGVYIYFIHIDAVRSFLSVNHV